MGSYPKHFCSVRTKFDSGEILRECARSGTYCWPRFIASESEHFSLRATDSHYAWLSLGGKKDAENTWSTWEWLHMGRRRPSGILIFLVLRPCCVELQQFKDWHLTTYTDIVHAGLLWCFHNPPNPDTDFNIFDMCIHMIFCIHVYRCAWGTLVYKFSSLIWRTFVVSMY